MEPIRVLIVDDSAVIRRQLSEVLASDPEIAIAGTAPSGQLGLVRIAELKPDLVTLDVEMPGMDGLQTLVEIRKLYPRLPTIMFSTLTGPGAGATVDALARGASDYATKPSQAGSPEAARAQVRNELVPKIKALCRRAAAPVRPPARVLVPVPATPARVDVVAIGSSTGGPNALVELIPQFPADFHLPILIVQHMPAMFTQLLASRLNAKAKIKVQEAKAGDKLKSGQIWIAPGDYHMVVTGEPRDRQIALNQNPPENSCRPAVDCLFRSVAASFGPHVLAVVLTGMGSDGTRGAEAIRKAGGTIIVQDEASSVVWGMPGSVVGAGLAEKICPLHEITPEIVRRTTPRKSMAGTGR